MYCVQSRSLGVCPTSRGLSCWGRSVTPCLWFRGGGGVSRVKGSARAPRLPGLIVLGGLQWRLTCGTDFRYSLWLPFVAAFAVLSGLLMVPVETIWGCVQSRELCARTSPCMWSILLGGPQWRLTCGSDFRNSLWLPFVAAFAVLMELLIVLVGTMGGFVKSRGFSARARFVCGIYRAGGDQ